MRRIRIAALILAVVAAPAQADSIADWTKIALDTAVRSGRPLEHNLRAMATVHVAMFETLNFIQGGYSPHFIVRSRKLDGLSVQAAAAAAAHHVLADLYPGQRADLAAALEASLHALPPRLDRATDVVIGTSIASICSSTSPRPEPWLLESVSPARPKSASTAQGPVRARYDSDVNASSIHFGTHPLSWNGKVAELISARELSPIERARIHALVSMAIADAYAVARNAPHQCAPCVATTAVAAILEAELGAQLAVISARSAKTDQDMGREISRHALRRYRHDPRDDH